MTGKKRPPIAPKMTEQTVQQHVTPSGPVQHIHHEEEVHTESVDSSMKKTDAVSDEEMEDEEISDEQLHGSEISTEPPYTLKDSQLEPEQAEEDEDTSYTLARARNNATRTEFRQKIVREVEKMAATNVAYTKQMGSIFSPELASKLNSVLDALKLSMNELGKVESSIATALSTVADTTEGCFKEAGDLTKLLREAIGEIRATENLFHQAARENRDLVKRVSDNSAQISNLQVCMNRLESTLNAIKEAMPQADTITSLQCTLNKLQESSVYSSSGSENNVSAPTPKAKPAKQFTCVLCNGPHWILQCDIYETSQDRKNRAKDVPVCIHCARRYIPGPTGKHEKCNRTNTQCSCCTGTRDDDETLHHLAFCFKASQERALARERASEQSRKRTFSVDSSHHEDLAKRQTLHPPVFPAQPPRAHPRGRGHHRGAPRGAPRGRGGYRGHHPSA